MGCAQQNFDMSLSIQAISLTANKPEVGHVSTHHQSKMDVIIPETANCQVSFIYIATRFLLLLQQIDQPKEEKSNEWFEMFHLNFTYL